MALLAALGGRALRREPLRQAAEVTGIATRLLDDPAAACQPCALSLRGAFDAQDARFSSASCAPSSSNGGAATAFGRQPGNWQPGEQWRGFAAPAAAVKPGSMPVPQVGTIYVSSTSNNTICTLVDGEGRTLGWCSAGSIGFKNSRKGTPYAAQATGENIAAKCREKGIVQVRLVVKGLGHGKLQAARALIKTGLRVLEIHEHTPLPYNGCRAPKRRR